MTELDRYREAEFPITRSTTYLDHAAVAPLPRRSVAAAQRVCEEQAEGGSRHFPGWIERLEAARERAAELLGARPDEVAFTGNTSHGLSLVAEGFPWRAGDVVVVTSPDFPSVLYPFMNLERRGVEVRLLERRQGRFTAEDVARALDGRARMVVAASIDWASGFRADLEAIGRVCRDHGAFLCVDAIQGLGLVPHDVRACGVHALAAGGHKWLLGPPGTGLLYVAREVNGVLAQTGAGWKSVTDELDFSLHFELKPDAGRFETGSPNLVGLLALGASLELLLEVGPGRAFERVDALTRALREGLEARGHRVTTPGAEGERSGILAFVPEEDPAACHARLADAGVRASLRAGAIRLAPHFYNDPGDVERFFAALDGS